MSRKKVVFCACRENKGATGGAGGVLFLSQDIIGSKIEDIECIYVFKNAGESQRAYVDHLLSYNADFYICHDVVSAFYLSLKNKKYVLIYHQQGPLVEERINLGLKLSPIKKLKTKLYERRAFEKAITVHFPSDGAKEMYFASQYRSTEVNRVCIGQTMYNTIDSAEESDHSEVDAFFAKSKCLTFYSVGTLTEAKGQDRVLTYLETVCTKTQKDIRYLLIGQGVMKDTLLSGLEQLKDKYSNFFYQYIPRIPHTEILRIGELADVYIMLHRISIFDLSTLEAMYKSNVVVLSDIGGNLDFNKMDNILYCDCINYENSVSRFLNSDMNALKELNNRCFNRYFSKAAFKNRYQELVMKLYE